MGNRIKILHVLDKLSYNSGVSAIVMNYLRYLNRERYELQVAVYHEVDKELSAELQQLKVPVIVLSPISLRQTNEFYREFKAVLEKNQYDIVHGHLANSAFLYLREAKKAGVPHRIIHYHNPVSAETVGKCLRNNLLEWRIPKWANHFFVCSSPTLQRVHKKKRENAILLPNAIDGKKFKYCPSVRERYRKSLEISEETIVLGHVGRLAKQKNQQFLLKVFQSYHSQQPESLLVIAGDGPLREALHSQAQALGIGDVVLFLGQRDDVPELYQAFDAFLLPSHFEGFGIVGVEAQCSGLPCFFSCGVPPEIDFTENCLFLPINEKNSESLWSQSLLEKIKSFQRMDQTTALQYSNFEISNMIKKLEYQYDTMIT